MGYGTRLSEYLTQANYVSYFILMTFAWLLVDAVGRRTILLNGSGVLTFSFLLLTVFGGLAFNNEELGIHVNAVAIPGIVVLFIATGAFGIGWLVPPWLIPTEIFPTTARAQGTAVSVITWGLANFAVTLITPLLFNNIKYWVFLVFAGTNAIAAIWTFLYCPETGGRCVVLSPTCEVTLLTINPKVVRGEPRVLRGGEEGRIMARVKSPRRRIQMAAIPKA